MAGGENIYRSFTFGDLASLRMLENRLVNRSNGEEDPLLYDGKPGDAVNPPAEAARARVAEIISGKPPQEWANDAELEAGVCVKDDEVHPHMRAHTHRDR